MAKYIMIGSGSKGNSGILLTNSKNILIDVGISYAKVTKALTEFNSPSIDYVLISHEHTDHIKGISTLYKKTDAIICLHRFTFNKLQEKMDISKDRCIFFEENDEFYLHDIKINTISTPHDSKSSVAFKITTDDTIYAHATDLGYMPKEVLDMLSSANMATVECNYDKTMLDFGSYPYHLKLRIKSLEGHLSNEEGLKCVAHLLQSGVSDIILGHLSQENNSPSILKEQFDELLFTYSVKQNQKIHIATQEFNNLVIERDYVIN